MARFGLQPLLDHSQHRLEAAERLLRMLRRKQDDAQRQLDQLYQFQDEYRERLRQTTSGGMSIQQLRDYQSFLAKVKVAIDHQAEELNLATQRWEAAHHQWLEQRQKVKAYETLAERHRTAETRRQERQEQKTADERAQTSRSTGVEGEDEGLA